MRQTLLGLAKATRLREAVLVLLLWNGAAGASAQSTDATRASGEAIPTRPGDLVLRTSLFLDGAGGIQQDRDIHVANGRIVAITPWGESFDYDLRGMTVTPGWIDTHAHIAARTDNAGERVLPNQLGSEAPEEAAMQVALNGWSTLRAGFTTVQSPGDRLDGPLRAMTSDGSFPGPRILSSLDLIQAEHAPTPEMATAKVRRMQAQGADFIKLFADGHGELGQNVLDAACGEARRLGLRTIVHSQSIAATRRVIEAGCTTVEHGQMLDQASFRAMKEAGMYYDPNLDIIVHYARLDAPLPEAATYEVGDMARMPPDYADYVATFRTALASGVKIVFGSDAVAGTHGANADEFVWRVIDGGQTPLDAITSATSVSAQSLGLDQEIGRIAQGMIADLVAVGGDLLSDIRRVKDVRFVMKHGVVYKHEPLRSGI